MRCTHRPKRLLLITVALGIGLLTGREATRAQSDPPERLESPIGTLVLDAVARSEQGRPERPARWDPSASAGLAGLERLLGRLSPLADTTRLESEHDTFVSEDREDDNFGRERLLYVGGPEGYGKSYTYLWFDMDELPRDQAITEADIELYLREAGPSGDRERTITAYPVEIDRYRGTTDCRDSWDERDLTWDDQPDRTDEVLDREDVGTTRDRYTLDITDAVVEWRRPEWNEDNRCNGGVVIHGDDRDGSFRGFDSSEASNEPELRLRHETDDRAPRGGMDPLPRFITAPTDRSKPNEAAFDLGWWGEDPEPGTGIDYFDLFGRANEGEWQALAREARSYGGRFIGENGIRYEFAVYPVDPAGNIKPPAPADAVTHVDFDPPVVTVDPLPEFMPGAFELRWSGVDQPSSPGRIGSGIDYYTVHYNIGGGSWGLLADGVKESHLRFDRAQQGLSYQFRVMGVDYAGHREPDGPFEAQVWIDGLPPVVTMPPVNSIDSPSFVVHWSGEDPGGSGLVSYDIQLRIDDGPWTNWEMGTTIRSRAFEGEYGHVYRFRARARDRAGNLGDWPDPPQLVTATVRRVDLTERIQLPLVQKLR